MSEDMTINPQGPGERAAAAPAMPLTMASAGQEVLLTNVRGGHQLVHRLAEMGLRPGVRFSVVSRGAPGPVIITMHGGRLVIGQGMALRMYVRPV